MSGCNHKMKGLNDHEDCACIECTRGPGTLDHLIKTGISNMGWVVIPVIDAQPFPFCYTVGLTETFGHPEFVMQGNFAWKQMANIINTAAKELAENPEAFRTDEVSGIIQVEVDGKVQNSVIGCRGVTRENKLALCCKATNRYGDDGFQVKQLILPDTQGRLPWHSGADAAFNRRHVVLY